MARNDKKTNSAHSGGSEDESSLEEREAQGSNPEMTDEEALSSEGEPIDGTQEAAAGDAAPSWGYEEKKRRFSKEIIIAFIAITLLLSVFSVIVWKSFFKKPLPSSPDPVVAGDPNKEDPFEQKPDPAPAVQPQTAATSTQTSGLFGSEGGNQEPQQPVERQVATFEPQEAATDPFGGETAKPKPTGLFDTQTEPTTDTAEPFPGNAVTTTNEPPPALLDQNATLETTLETEPVRPKPVVNTRPNRMPAFDAEPVMEERTPAESTFVNEPQPDPSEFKSPRPIAADTLPERIRPNPAMLETENQNGGEYIVKEGDNFWEISKKIYGTHGLFLALYEFNRGKVPSADLLRPGTILQVPEREALKPLAATIAATEQPKLGRPRVSPNVRRTSIAESGLFFREAGLPVYRVGKNDSLRKIALDHLGREERWEQIYNMNQELLKSEDDMRPGLELRLPADASRVALSEDLSPRR